jgi:hypothetical protein
MLCSYASVNEEKLSSLQNLEQELDQTLLAYNCHQATPAQLSAEQLEKLQTKEKELGIIIVAI